MIAEAITGQRRRRARLLPADQPLGPRGDLRRAPLRAVRLRPDDRRPRRADARRGQELVADRDGGLEHGRDQPVDPGHPPRARRPARGARDPRRRGPGSGRRGGSAARPTRSRSRPAARAATPVAAVEVVVDGRPIEGTLRPAPRARHAARAGRGPAGVIAGRRADRPAGARGLPRAADAAARQRRARGRGAGRRPARGSSGSGATAPRRTCSPRRRTSAGRRRSAGTSCSAATGCGSRRRTRTGSPSRTRTGSRWSALVDGLRLTGAVEPGDRVRPLDRGAARPGPGRR